MVATRFRSLTCWGHASGSICENFKKKWRTCNNGLMRPTLASRLKNPSWTPHRCIDVPRVGLKLAVSVGWPHTSVRITGSANGNAPDN